MPAAILADTVQPYIGKTMDAAGLTSLANTVSAAYGEVGAIALYTVSVPDQDFANGIVRLTVTEGSIEHVDLAGDVTGNNDLIMAYAQKLTLEKPLHRTTLQRYLSLMRDIPGLTIDTKLVQGQTGGGVRLILTLTRKQFMVHLNMNDAGVSILGRYQGVVELSLYNLLREGEETKLSFGTSTVFSRYQYYGLGDSEIVNEEGTTASASVGYLRTDVGKLALSGGAKTAQVGISHPLIRSFDENLTLGGDLDGIDSKNALLGQLFANEKVRTVRATASYSLSDPQWLLALSANLSQGLDVAGERVSQPGAAKSDFQKLVAGASFNHLLGKEFVVRLRAISQMAFGPLPVSELYSLGGPDFGRGFLIATALGDSAIAGSLELGWQPTGIPLPGSEVFVFGDDGGTWYRERNLGYGILPGVDYHLASAGGGVRLPIFGDTKLELQGANALASNAPTARAGLWRFLIGLTSTL